MLEELKKTHGHSYYVFIAPFELAACNELRAFVLNMREDEPVPDILLASRKDLDIYFVDRKHDLHGDLVLFTRLSTGGAPPL